MADVPTADELRLFLPKYLSPERQDQLWHDLRRFPDSPVYTTRNEYPHALQGDGWEGFIAIDFKSGDKKAVPGVVLSNSCDIAPQHRRPLIPNVIYVPLIRLARYADLLKAAGQTDQQIDSALLAIRKQEITSLLYLPAVPGVMPESITLFGDAHSEPLDYFSANHRALLFRLSDFGFYLFLFKLSIHFTRMYEDADRQRTT